MGLCKAVKKKEFIYHIEQIKVFPLEECYRVRLYGWAFSKTAPESKVHVGEAACVENLILEPIRRADVGSCYSQYGNVSDCGFECQFDYKKEAAKTGKIEFYLAEQKICSIPLTRLNRYLVTPGLECRVDDYYYIGGRMIVNGWAYASLAYGECRRPELHVWNASEREVACKVSDRIRLDVERQTGQPVVNGNLGYRLEFQAKKDEAYRLEFVLGDDKKQITVNESGMKRVLYLGEKAARKGVRVLRRLLGKTGKGYPAWEKEQRVTKEEWSRQQQERFADMPKISVVVPAYRTPEKFLREMIASVREQSYENWELCIADGSMDDSICGILEEYAQADKRIKYKKLADNYGISGNTNEALKLATGDYLSLLDHDDLLTPDALYEVVKRINATGAEVLYTDEDKVTMDLKEYFEPHFKPDYNLDLLRSCNYICHFFVVKRNVLEQVGAFREECNGSQDYDYILRCTSAANRVEHIARVLYHWRCHPNSTAGDPQSKMYCYEAGKRALELDLAAHGIEGAEVAIDSHFGYYRVCYPMQPAKTAVIILPYGSEEEVQRTKASILQYTTDTECEILVADKDLGIGAAFNRVAHQTDADYLLFLQAGMTVLGDDWLKILLGNCQREEVGAVGASVLVNGRYVAHSGKLLGIGDSLVRDMFEMGIAGDAGYAGRMLAQQEVRGISWRGMMIERSLFLAMGGFEEALQELYMDIDLCLKLQRAGKSVVYTPYTAFDIERVAFYSEASGNESDEAWIREKWKDELAKEEPCYNRNFDVNGAGFALPF